MEIIIFILSFLMGIFVSYLYSKYRDYKVEKRIKDDPLNYQPMLERIILKSEEKILNDRS